MRFPLQRLALAFSFPLILAAPALAQGYDDEWQPPAALALFSGANFTGEVREAFDPFASMHDLAFNDRARSVAVLAGQWELCEHHNFTGRCVFVREDVADLGWFGLNNHISSVRPIFEYTEAQHGLMFSRDDYGYIRYAHNESYGHGTWNRGYSSSVRISVRHYGFSPDYIRYGYYDPRWGYDPYGFAWSPFGGPRYVSYVYRVHPRPIVINNYWRTNWASSHPKWHRRGHRDDWRRNVDWRGDGRDNRGRPDSRRRDGDFAGRGGDRDSRFEGRRPGTDGRDNRGRPDNRRREGDFAGRGGDRDNRFEGRRPGTDGPGNRGRPDDRRRDGNATGRGGEGDGRRGGDFAGRGGQGGERPDTRRPGGDRREEGRPGNRGSDDGRPRWSGATRSADAAIVPGTRTGVLPSDPRRSQTRNLENRPENRGGPGRTERPRADRTPRPDTGSAPGQRGARDGRTGTQGREQTGTPPARGPSVRTIGAPPVTATSQPQGRPSVERSRAPDQARPDRSRQQGLMGGPGGGGRPDANRTRGPSTNDSVRDNSGRDSGSRAAPPPQQPRQQTTRPPAAATPAVVRSPQPSAAPSRSSPPARAESGGGRRSGDGQGRGGGRGEGRGEGRSRN